MDVVSLTSHPHFKDVFVLLIRYQSVPLIFSLLVSSIKLYNVLSGLKFIRDTIVPEVKEELSARSTSNISPVCSGSGDKVIFQLTFVSPFTESAAAKFRGCWYAGIVRVAETL